MAYFTNQELIAAIESTSIKCRYNYVFESAELPASNFIIVNSPNKISAENVSYMKVDNIQLSVFSTQKDSTKELEIEQALLSLGINFQSQDLYDANEKVYNRMYLFERFIKIN